MTIRHLRRRAAAPEAPGEGYLSAGMLRRALAKIDYDGTLALDFTQVAIGQQGLDKLLSGKDRPEAHVADGARFDAQSEHEAVHLVDWRREPRVQTDAVRNSLVQCLHFANLHVEPTEVRPLRREREAVQLGPQFRIAVYHAPFQVLRRIMLHSGPA